MYNSIIVRLSGEIAIKSRAVRDLWERKIYWQIVKRLSDIDATVVREGLRLYIVTNAVDEVISKLRFIFGVSSISPAIMCGADLQEIRDSAEKLVRFALGKRPYSTFGIIVKKKLRDDISSMDLKNIVGEHIRRIFNLRVYLDAPELPIYVEIRKDRAFVYTENIEGPGGIPIGTQATVVSLMSEGPDSTLATWLVMRRGSKVIGVYFDFGAEDFRREALNRVLRVAEILARDWEGLRKLYVVHFTRVASAILIAAKPKNAYVLLKRYMLRTARIIMEREKARAIVTGEIIGEHASQTIDNLTVIDDAVSGITILRPVVGYDKMEIFKKLLRIDKRLYEITNKSIEPCRDLTTIKPTTKAKIDSIREDEELLGIDDDVLRRLVDDAMVIEF